MMEEHSIEERLARLERLEDLISISLGRIEDQVTYLLMKDWGLVQFEQWSPKLRKQYGSPIETVEET